MLDTARPFSSTTVRAVTFCAAAMSLVAVTYGMARFGVGLLHPATAAQRPGVASALPSAGAAQFASYCVAAATAAFVVRRRPRVVAAAAGAVAGAGCLGLAVSTSAGWYVGSAFVAGAGAGFASPALVDLLDEVVPPRLASAAQTVVNAGTSVGVIAAGALSAAVDAPGVAWPLVAGLCVATATAVVLLGPGPRPVARPSAGPSAGASAPPSAPDGRVGRGVVLVLPLTAAVGAGFLSAGTWTYGPTAVVARGALESGSVGLLWTALGVGGIVGGLVDRPVARLGPVVTFALCTATLVVASVAVLSPGLEGAWWPLAGAACFGAAYMAMSGVLILWGRLLDPDRGAAVTAWLFLALAVGQAVGAQALGPALS